MQPRLFIDRLELIHGPGAARLAKQIVGDIEQVSPGTEVREHLMSLRDHWDFSEVYTNLRDSARAYTFDTEREDYLVNITTGTHVAQICWFLLTEARFIPAWFLQLSPPPRRTAPEDPVEIVGSHSIIDLDLSRYDAIYRAKDAEAGQTALDALEAGSWGQKYPAIPQS